MSGSNNTEELAHDLSPLLKVHKDGRVERLFGTATVPPSLDPATGVASVDVVICPETGLSARLYAPEQQPQPDVEAAQKSRPLLVYFHGGGFLIESAFSTTYHGYLNAVAARADAVILSVDYRLAPEHHLPAAYDDAWAALKWVASRSTSDHWLAPRGADRARVYLAGDSAGANIVHRVAVRAGTEGVLEGVVLRGAALIHPYFWGSEPIGDEASAEKAGAKALVEKLWPFACSGSVGFDDPWINPAKDPDVARLGCGRVVVFVAEKDGLRDRGRQYGDILEKAKGSGWGGTVEVVEDEGENHVFHLFNPGCDKAVAMMGKICNFITQDSVGERAPLGIHSVVV